MLEDGNDTRFWDDTWVGEEPLKLIFPRLYNLSQDKEGRVGEMGEWKEGVWRWKWRWRRNFFIVNLLLLML